MSDPARHPSLPPAGTPVSLVLPDGDQLTGLRVVERCDGRLVLELDAAPSERRARSRVAPVGALVVVGQRRAEDGRWRRVAGLVKDVSLTGLAFHTQSAVELGDDLELEVASPTGATLLTPTRFTAVRVDPQAGDHLVACAVDGAGGGARAFAQLLRAAA